MARQEIYISMDVEADGPVPGLNSMLSFGAAAFTIEKRLLGTFSRNLVTLPEARPDPRTMEEFWAKNPQAWAETQRDPITAEAAIRDFAVWLDEVSEGAHSRAYFVGYPAPYDFKWIDYYTHRFLGRNPFGFNGCIDAKVVAWTHLGGPFSSASPRNFPKCWFDPLPHTHVALDDAVAQGAMFVNMLRNIRGLPALPPIVWNPRSASDPVPAG